MTVPFHADSPSIYKFYLKYEEEKYIGIISDTSSKVQFPRNSHTDFGWTWEGSSPGSAGKL
jgi:hypothetical protein